MSDGVTGMLGNRPGLLRSPAAYILFLGRLHPSACVCGELVMQSGGLDGEGRCQTQSQRLKAERVLLLSPFPGEGWT